MWAKQHYYARSRSKPVITELQLNLQKHINMCCCSFNKVSMKRKKLSCKKILT